MANKAHKRANGHYRIGIYTVKHESPKWVAYIDWDTAYRKEFWSLRDAHQYITGEPMYDADPYRDMRITQD